ncbi:NAD(P)-dependent oxidoreductase [Prauserella oleivorans]
MVEEQHYLAGLDLAGRRVVVVGGGTVAQRRLPRLVRAGAVVEVISPDTTPSVSAMADAGRSPGGSGRTATVTSTPPGMRWRARTTPR